MSRIASFGQVRQREPRVRDKAHLGFIVRLPCIACAIEGRMQSSRSEAAHVKVGYPEDGWRAFGHSERAHDWRCVPLCAHHHREGPMAQHRNRGGDERTFWDRLGVHPPAFCAALVDAFAAGDNGRRVVEKFAVEARAKLAAGAPSNLSAEGPAT